MFQIKCWKDALIFQNTQIWLVSHKYNKGIVLTVALNGNIPLLKFKVFVIKK